MLFDSVSDQAGLPMRLGGGSRRSPHLLFPPRPSVIKLKRFESDIYINPHEDRSGDWERGSGNGFDRFYRSNTKLLQGF
jgi:hypothetical protein